ncbi:hypothetical protein [Ensifer sesbaniae]|uniref:hypothetical protein n=1 Tax=Ensifer sesbaniae TaxID=1214071 RepID=UPI001AEE708C|nr:hypothetical protein [Ensifer sesbaniae]
MYDEQIRRSARRYDVEALDFAHPLEVDLFAAVSKSAERARSIILTGTAGDGKSRLCGRLWTELGGSSDEWTANEIYQEISSEIAGRVRTVGIIRDLTALPAQGTYGIWEGKNALLAEVNRSFFSPDPDWIFVVAANDGQLLDTWRRAAEVPLSKESYDLLETCLVEGKPASQGGVAFFNLSAVSCANIIDLTLEAIVAHPGWAAAYDEAETEGFFSEACPIRRNYEVLSSPQFKSRLRQLFELMDLNELHTPIRRVLLLIANMLLGHPAAKDRLMSPTDIRPFIRAGRAHLADIHQNLFGANLTPARRESLEIFEFLNRFGIGDETTNRIDNILVFGASDETLRPYYESLVEGAFSSQALDELSALRNDYLERPDATQEGEHPFLTSLQAQRRAIFFQIRDDQSDDLRLWDLTVFRHAGEFLRDVVAPLQDTGKASRAITARLVNGLNRIFTGMLVTTDRELLIAAGLSGSAAGLSQILIERISVVPRRYERIELRNGTLPTLVVQIDDGIEASLKLNLVRYEFLMRVAGGALPGSFSKECHEDILAFKSAILAAFSRSRPPAETTDLSFRILGLNGEGEPVDDVIEVNCA